MRKISDGILFYISLSTLVIDSREWNTVAQRNRRTLANNPAESTPTSQPK